jgi:vancomycin resistance protein YoaR
MVAVAAVVGLVGAAWAIDRARGVEVGHLGPGSRVVLHAPGGDVTATAAELGLEVDVEASAQAHRDARSAGPLDWFKGVLGRRRAPLVVRVDEATAIAAIRAMDPTTRQEPVEPSIEGTTDGIEVRPGRAGRGLDPEAVVRALRDAAAGADGTVDVDVEPVALRPRHTRAEAESLAEQARRWTDRSLALTAGGKTVTIPARTLRSWVRSDDDVALALDEEEVLTDLRDRFASVATEPVDATIRISDGQPVIVAGRNGTRCCADSAVDAILRALTRPARGPVALELRSTPPARTAASLAELKIAEPIATFTTRYPARQTRVTNIHRIADLIDDTLIGPGGRFSVNDKVGERTPEKGFVPAGSIADGVFTDSVGGGISQFATTLFNAAFFGGLDLTEYQSHSIYISRYPYGREATLSWRQPDLVITNETPYGVLVDTAYTSSSITVTLWSTKHATGEQTNQTTSPVGNCTRVKTERTRTYVDGTTKVDYVYATYRPEEGVNCSGPRTPPSSTTTTTPPSTTTTTPPRPVE